jgi:DNA modification methylase
METNRIIIGDTLTELKKLPADSIDMGVTSPPYNKGERHQGWLVDNVLYDKAGDGKDEDEYQAEQVAVLDELYRVIKPGGAFFYNHKLRWERGWLRHPFAWVSRSKWVIRQEIIWHRKIAGNIRGWRFWQVEERIYWLYKPTADNAAEPIGKELESRHAKMTSIWDIRPERKLKWIPDAFPLELPGRCIYSILSDSRGIVIDPYAGSGTTLVAAKLLGSEYIGIELSENYAAGAEERLSNAFMEKDKLADECAKHRVALTFKMRKEKGLSKPRVRRKRLF